MFHCEECDSVLETSADGAVDGLSRRERTKIVKAKQVHPASQKILLYHFASVVGAMNEEFVPMNGRLALQARPICHAGC